MKRSEMSFLIAQELFRSNKVDPTECGNLAELVLDFIEKNGMLPPTRTEKSVLPGVQDFVVNKWEPEDDAK